MRTKNTSHYTLKQRKNRNKILGFLHDYWKQDIFPINTTHKERIPQIKDQKGTPCALAYILENSGEQQLVEEIAKQNNYVKVGNVPKNHPLNYAIRENGFTRKEAIKIQPWYCQCDLLANQAPIFGTATIFFSILIVIAGLASSVFVYLITKSKIQKYPIIVGIMGASIIGASFIASAPDTILRLYEYPGTLGTYSIDEERVVLYWVLNGEVTNIDRKAYYTSLKVDATSNGEITVVMPGMKCGHPDEKKIFPQASSIIVLMDREEILVSPTIENKQFVVTIPFEKGKRQIEILGPDPVC